MIRYSEGISIQNHIENMCLKTSLKMNGYNETAIWRNARGKERRDLRQKGFNLSCQVKRREVLLLLLLNPLEYKGMGCNTDAKGYDWDSEARVSVEEEECALSCLERDDDFRWRRKGLTWIFVWRWLLFFLCLEYKKPLASSSLFFTLFSCFSLSSALISSLIPSS